MGARRRFARRRWRAARGAGAPRPFLGRHADGPGDQRRRVAALPRHRGRERAVGTLDLVDATGTRPILPSALCRTAGPTVPPWWSERPAAPRGAQARGPAGRRSGQGIRGAACATDRSGSWRGRAVLRRPVTRSSPRRFRRGLDRSREVKSAADPEHLRAADRAGALGSGLPVLHRDVLRVLHLALCLALDAVRFGHSGSLPFVTVDVVGPLARRSSVTSDTGSALPSGADSSNPTDPGRRELSQR
jgi:hypothetical protein